MKYVKMNENLKEQVINFFQEHWGSSKMVISSGIYDCDLLPGFACVTDSGEIIGLITYVDREEEREIVSLDSVVEKKGIGSSLMELVEEEGRQLGIRKIKLITSNDNIYALKFYQKRGYRLMRILHDAVDEARKLKPQIPLVGYHGIPIKDEIILEKQISS